MASIEIALTFDDGPDGIAADETENHPKRYNTTERILTMLDSPGEAWPEPIKAAFFVQTHAKERMATAHGKKLVKRAFDAGHVVGIQSGSTHDRKHHIQQQTDGELSANLILASQEVTAVTGVPPTFVRGPFGLRDAKVDGAYANAIPGQPLSYVYWDFEGTDLSRRASGDPEIEAYLTEQVRGRADKIRGKDVDLKLVVQLHDVSFLTAVSLPKFIAALAAGGLPKRRGGKPVAIRFCRTRAEVEAVLRQNQSVRGDIEPKSYERIHPLDEADQPVVMTWYLIAFEEYVSHLYVDSEGKVTVGIGHNILSEADMDSITMVKPDKKTIALVPEKREEWKAIGALDKGKLASWYKDRGPHKLSITPDAALELLKDDRTKRGISKVIDKLGDYYRTAPLPARLGLVDMCFNMGAKKWASQFLGENRKFGPLIEDRDWDGAAFESKRRERPAKGGIPKERNLFTKRLFKAAQALDHWPMILATITPPASVITAVPEIAPVHITIVPADGWTLVPPFKVQAEIRYSEHGRMDELTIDYYTSNTPDFDLPMPSSIVQGGTIRVSSLGVKLTRARDASTVQLVQDGLIRGENPLKTDVKFKLATLTEPEIKEGATKINIGLSYQAIAYHASTTYPGANPAQTAFTLFDSEGKPIFPVADFFGLLHLPTAKVAASDGRLLWHWLLQLQAAQTRLKAIHAAAELAVAAARAKNKGTAALDPKQRLLECLQRYGTGADDAKTLKYWKWDSSTKTWKPLSATPTYADKVLKIYTDVENGQFPPGWQ